VASSRRSFLQVLAGGSLCLAEDNAISAKPLRGVFPIAQTPFTDSDKLDLDVLLEQLRFIDRGGVHGFVWPQLASEWASLSEAERMAGSEALGAAAKKLRPALILGVQAPSAEAAVRFAVHAKKVGADAIISLPPPGQTDSKVIAGYYQKVGAATDLPLFVQAVGKLSVATLVEMYKSIPTFRYVKDEAGEPLFRMHELHEQTRGEMKIFTGSHGRTMIDEMNRGASGTMPAASFADLYATVWDSWHAGNHREAMETFGRISMLISEVNVYGIASLKYILQLRGVFQNCRTRESANSPLDEKGKEVIRQMMEEIKPWLRTR